MAMVTTPPLVGVPVSGGTEPKAPGSVSAEDAAVAVVVVAPATRTSAAAKAVPARARC